MKRALLALALVGAVFGCRESEQRSALQTLETPPAIEPSTLVLATASLSPSAPSAGPNADQPKEATLYYDDATQSIQLVFGSLKTRLSNVREKRTPGRILAVYSFAPFGTDAVTLYDNKAPAAGIPEWYLTVGNQAYVSLDAVKRPNSLDKQPVTLDYEIVLKYRQPSTGARPPLTFVEADVLRTQRVSPTLTTITVRTSRPIADVISEASHLPEIELAEINGDYTQLPRMGTGN